MGKLSYEEKVQLYYEKKKENETPDNFTIPKVFNQSKPGRHSQMK